MSVKKTILTRVRRSVLFWMIKFERKRLALNPFLTRNQIAICVLFGFIGFIYAVLVIVYTSDKSSKIYGELRIEGMTEHLDTLLNKRIAILQDSTDSVDKRIVKKHNELLYKPTDAVIKADETLLLRRKKDLMAELDKSRQEFYRLKYRSSDTGMAYLAIYINLDKKELADSLNSVYWRPGKVKQISAFITDTAKFSGKPLYSKNIKLNITQHKNEKIMEFIRDYPLFGYWIVVTIAQMMLWFLLYPMLAGNLLNLKDILGQDYYHLGFRQRCINLLLPLLFVGVFCLSFYWYLADNYVITDYYFFSGYNDRMLIYAIPGYIVAIYCFTSYLTLATQFSKMDEAADANQALLIDPLFAKKFSSLRKAFDNTLLFSAIILSLMIFWVGIVINALNNTDAFRFYTTIAGKPFIPGEYVYLMALMHTVILLTFYLPVRLQFSTMEITQPNALTGGGTPTKNIFEIIMSNFGSILITTAPLLAGFMQDLLQAFFKN